MMRRLLALLAIFVGVLAAAGCGGGGGGGDRLSKEEYAQRVASTGDTIESSFAKLGNEASSLSAGDASSLDELLDKLAKVVRESAASLRSSAEDLEGINPPEDAEQAHDKLVQGLSLLAEDIDELADAVEGGQLQEIQELGTRLENITTSEAGRLLEEATEELKEKGYSIEGQD
jgi:hypothetical protein